MSNLRKEYGLTPKSIVIIHKKMNDLIIQAMLFDMDVDIETFSLTPKREQPPRWLVNWKNKQDEADNDPASPEQAGW